MRPRAPGAGPVWSPLERWNLHFSGSSGESLLVGREGSGRFAGTTASLAWNRYL